MTIENLKISSALSNVTRMKLERNQEIFQGYPYIDRPWEQYYEGYVPDLKNTRTVYQEIVHNNIDYPKDIALEFFKSKISYHSFFNNVDLAAKSFKEYGIKKGDFVTICMPGLPETAYSFYALSKIGAIANMITPFFGSDENLIKRIEDCESDILIVMDGFYDEIKDAIRRSRIKNIVVVPTLNSSIFGLFSKKYKLESSNEMYWNQFIKDGKKRDVPDTIDYEPNMPVVMMCTSASTSKSPKGVLLSNDSIQNSIQSYPALGVDLTRKQKFYQIIPMWCSTGLITCLHLPLAYGTTVFMDPRVNREVFVKNIIKNKPNYVVGTTSMFEGFLYDELVGNSDLSHFNYPFEGGEYLSPDVARQINEVFEKHGSKAKMGAAYGQCECGAAITSQTQKVNHENGSVGIPLPGVLINAFDENNNKLSYYEPGEIYANTPCGMLEYFKNSEKTDEYFYTDEDGVKWNRTGDIGYIDENGELFILGRDSDNSIIDNHKIYNFEVENAIMKLDEIKMCEVYSIKHNDTDNLLAHIIFTDEFVQSLDDDDLTLELRKIQDFVYKTTGSKYMVPSVFKIRESFPFTKGSKRDLFKMKEETDGFIYMDDYVSSKVKKLSLS